MSRAKLSTSSVGVDPVVPLLTALVEVVGPALALAAVVLEPVAATPFVPVLVGSTSPVVASPVVPTSPVLALPMVPTSPVLAALVLGDAELVLALVDTESLVTSSPPPELPSDAGPLEAPVPAPPEQATVTSTGRLSIAFTLLCYPWQAGGASHFLRSVSCGDFRLDKCGGPRASAYHVSRERPGNSGRGSVGGLRTPGDLAALD